MASGVTEAPPRQAGRTTDAVTASFAGPVTRPGYTPKPPLPNSDTRGSGFVELSRVAGTTAVTTARANSPRALLTPGVEKRSAWVFTGTLGGGLVFGDHLHLDVRMGENTTALLGTQASTKVYRSLADRSCRQDLHVRAADEALCVALPDPITCFAGARYAQRLTFDLAPAASLVLVDWLTSGRRAMGERWAFAHYESRIDISVGGRH